MFPFNAYTKKEQIGRTLAVKDSPSFLCICHHNYSKLSCLALEEVTIKNNRISVVFYAVGL